MRLGREMIVGLSPCPQGRSFLYAALKKLSASRSNTKEVQNGY